VLPQKKVEQQNNENDPKERINKSRQKATKNLKLLKTTGPALCTLHSATNQPSWLYHLFHNFSVGVV
jgi:hypothetical protein